MIDIITARLYLRKFQHTDANSMFLNWANDPEVTRYMTWNPHESIEVTKKLLEYWIEEYKNPKTYRWAITLKKGELIGSIDVVSFLEGNIPVIGYCLSRKYWNQGYMTEAAQSVVDYLRFVGYKKLYIEAEVDNIASNKVIKKLGFKYINTVDKFIDQKNEIHSLNCYELIID